MIGALSNALGGLFNAGKRAEGAANAIANASTPGYSVDLAQEAVNLKIAEIEYKANARVIAAADDMAKELGRIFDQKV